MPATMRRIARHQYGPPEVLRLENAPRPQPAADEVLVRVRATTVNYGDLLARDFRSVRPSTFNMPYPLLLLSRLYFGPRRPRQPVLGSEFAGRVESVGTDVDALTPGDRVLGYTGQGMGGYAEYLRVKHDAVIAPTPASMTDEQAAAFPYGAITAVGLLRDVEMQGRSVLIVGASGGIGSFAVQLARHAGAEVTGVAGTARLERVRALGADHVVDYTKEDFTASGRRYDLIVDVLGGRSFRDVRGALTDRGTYLLASFKTPQLAWAVRTRFGSGPRVRCVLTGQTRTDLLEAVRLAEAGALTPRVDRTLPLEQAAEAHRYAESDARSGTVVLTVG
ncbi:MAG: NAD(P)-dependent alcohol dehydrogenase [Candidatus Longimicrobiales bacterium M2_2A_002]